MAIDRNIVLATLDLVCPPLPDSLASTLAQNKSAETVLRQSDFYMICGRAAATFSAFDMRANEGHLYFSIEVKGVGKTTGSIDIKKIKPVANLKGNPTLNFTHGDRHIHVSSTNEFGVKTLIYKFAPDDILMRKGRKDSLVSGFDDYRQLATYDLLYVGIATVGDSFDRLFTKGHRARTQILSAEMQRSPGARVSDEIYLFLFKVDPLYVKTFSSAIEIEDDDLPFLDHGKRIVADAEKAFVSLLKPTYNRELYARYPKGKNGLHETGYSGYSYSISEGMTFRTPYGAIKGARGPTLTLSNEADFIAIRGDEVQLHISGVDFDVS